MHVSRVAALLLRAVRRSRRPLAIAVVSLIVAGICVVTDVSGAAMAAEQPTQPSPTASGSSALPARPVTPPPASSAPAPSSSSQSGSSSRRLALDPRDHDLEDAEQRVHDLEAVKTAGQGTGQRREVLHRARPRRAARTSRHRHAPAWWLPPRAGPALTLSGSSAVADTNHDGRTSAGDVVTTTWKVKNGGTDPATAPDGDHDPRLGDLRDSTIPTAAAPPARPRPRSPRPTWTRPRSASRGRRRPPSSRPDQQRTGHRRTDPVGEDGA